MNCCTLPEMAEQHGYELMVLRLSPYRRRYALVRKEDFTSPAFAAKTALIFPYRKDVEGFLWGMGDL